MEAPRQHNELSTEQAEQLHDRVRSLKDKVSGIKLYRDQSRVLLALIPRTIEWFHATLDKVEDMKDSLRSYEEIDGHLTTLEQLDVTIPEVNTLRNIEPTEQVGEKLNAYDEEFARISAFYRTFSNALVDGFANMEKMRKDPVGYELEEQRLERERLSGPIRVPYPDVSGENNPGQLLNSNGLHFELFFGNMSSAFRGISLLEQIVQLDPSARHEIFRRIQRMSEGEVLDFVTAEVELPGLIQIRERLDGLFAKFGVDPIAEEANKRDQMAVALFRIRRKLQEAVDTSNSYDLARVEGTVASWEVEPGSKPKDRIKPPRTGLAKFFLGA